jgi:hypothetical protein
VDAIDTLVGFRCISSQVMIINHIRKPDETRCGLAHFF